MNKENEIFEQQVDRWVYEAVNNGVTNFNSLVTVLPGVYPTIVLESLERLISGKKISEHIFSIETRRDVNAYLVNADVQPVNCYYNLPVPHPLDYDWRFTDPAINYILDHCLETTQPNEKIALLGAPSIYQKTKTISFSRQIKLFDNNPTITNHFSKNATDSDIIICDILRDDITENGAATVITDPPWYEKHLFSFMWTAAKICQLDGYILISLPPIGTRPGIESELERFFEWAESLGLALSKYEKATLSYVSPPFEINSLRAENFYDLNEDWRRGDLAVFIKKRHTSVERPVIAPDLEERWLEEIVNGVRIKLKPYNRIEFNDPKLLTIVNNDIFPGVSRRDERRKLAEVWTSGNRVFACQGRFVLQEILRELSSGQSATEVLAEKLNRLLNKQEKELINKSKEQMLEIIAIEREENSIFAYGNNQ